MTEEKGGRTVIDLDELVKSARANELLLKTGREYLVDFDKENDLHLLFAARLVFWESVVMPGKGKEKGARP
jgi:hypothetical protein